MDAAQERLEKAKIKQLEKIAAILDRIDRHLKALDGITPVVTQNIPESHKEVIENDDPFRVGHLKDGTPLNFTCDVTEGKLDEI